jgi:hypothetical protein
LQGTREQWQASFYVAAAIYFFGAVFYTICGAGEVQPWAEFHADPDEDAEEGKGNEEDVGFGLHDIREKNEDDNDEDEEDKAAEKMLKGVNGEQKV